MPPPPPPRVPAGPHIRRMTFADVGVIARRPMPVQQAVIGDDANRVPRPAADVAAQGSSETIEQSENRRRRTSGILPRADAGYPASVRRAPARYPGPVEPHARRR